MQSLLLAIFTMVAVGTAIQADTLTDKILGERATMGLIAWEAIYPEKLTTNESAQAFYDWMKEWAGRATNPRFMGKTAYDKAVAYGMRLYKGLNAQTRSTALFEFADLFRYAIPDYSACQPTPQTINRQCVIDHAIEIYDACLIRLPTLINNLEEIANNLKDIRTTCEECLQESKKVLTQVATYGTP